MKLMVHVNDRENEVAVSHVLSHVCRWLLRVTNNTKKAIEEERNTIHYHLTNALSSLLYKSFSSLNAINTTPVNSFMQFFFFFFFFHPNLPNSIHSYLTQQINNKIIYNLFHIFFYKSQCSLFPPGGPTFT